MHHVFKVGDKVIHRWTNKGYGQIVDMDDNRLMITVLWNKDEPGHVTTREFWEALSYPRLHYPGHNPQE